jgi:biopolymer transport protein TolR
MAMQVRSARGGPISSINVTPMADVIIVLLIIFMVTIPVITRGDVDLPDALSGETRPDGPIVVTLRSDGVVALTGHGPIALSDLTAVVRERLAGGGAGVKLKANQGMSYNRVAEVLAACREAGAEEVSIMTEERPVGP